MLLSSVPTSQRLRASPGAGACSSRFCPSLPAARVNRRPCKPVCFKENTPDKIDDATTTRTSGVTTGGVPPRSYGTEPMMMPPVALRSVSLGPVASVMYPLLTYGTAAAAAAAIVMPATVGKFVFPSAVLTTVNKLMIQCAGAALLPSVVAKRQIKHAADSGILASPTYKQMVSACLLGGVLELVVLSQAVSLRNPLLAATVGGLAGLATLTTSYTLMKIRESGQLVPSPRGVLSGLMSLLTPATITAAAYSLATIALTTAGIMLFTSDPATPSLLFILPKDPVHVFCARIMGAATLANAVLMFVVKQAADDGRQGSPLFRSINGGVASSSAITAGVLGYGLATNWAKSVPHFWALFGTMAATALLSGYNWMTAP
ncbi:hypothetical protein PLESTB_000112700 [Pleodorina starrii]|uniref:Uncharacterized protein n=1 Tax=Pleodorina starrii TaxID=330485 RepID=A0A9W6BAM7_9CHLO|nr:hypothetical protein PLESTM_000108400 [Pleodorina starrii]GLC48574.1 hypothetical protein PLESTB_000112700 [Pleodorina starrii]GLC71895.1 hypothetical protein PLESTF_001178400 [Pleodorina starrii]